jgi:hypothetical protein
MTLRPQVKQLLLGPFASRMKKRSMFELLSRLTAAWRSIFMRSPSFAREFAGALAAERHAA